MHDIAIRHARLPDGYLGWWDPEARTIWLDRDLDQTERRCTLLHELVHARRGDVACADPVLDARQEARVERECAQSLVPGESLAEAVRWSRDPHEVAEALGVDIDTLTVRLIRLSAAERARLDEVVSALGATA